MDKSDIKNIIFEAIEMVNNIREDDSQIPVALDAELYGSNGSLDSMGLVAFLIDIEDALLDQDIEVSLSDERAMSQSRSPFKTVETLVEYIYSLIKGAD